MMLKLTKKLIGLQLDIIDAVVDAVLPTPRTMYGSDDYTEVARAGSRGR